MNALPVPCATEAPFATNLGLREIRKEYPIFAVLQKGSTSSDTSKHRLLRFPPQQRRWVAQGACCQFVASFISVDFVSLRYFEICSNPRRSL